MDVLGVGPQIEPGRPIRVVLVERKGFGDVEQLGFGQPNQRASEQRAERQSVASIGERSRQSNEVLDLLTTEEALARLRRNRDAAILERLFKSPKLGSDRRQQRDVAQATGPHLAVMAPDQSILDETAAEIGDTVRLGVTQLVGLGVVFIGDIQRGDRDRVSLRLTGRRQLGEAGLSGLGRQDGFELVVDEAKDRLDRSEVRGDLQEPGIADGRACADIGVHVGASETIDRLFGIADQKQRPGTKRPSQRIGAAVLSSLAAEPPENVDLQRIGVLKLVDENMPKSTRQRLADLFVSSQQIARRIEQVVEIEQRGGVFVRAPIVQEAVHRSGDAREKLSCDSLP